MIAEQKKEIIHKLPNRKTNWSHPRSRAINPSEENKQQLQATTTTINTARLIE
jgi:hypothetical protein